MDLGISLSEFMSLTPRLFFAMYKRRIELDRRDDLRYGVIASVLCAVNGQDRPPGSFFGHKISRERLAAEKRLEVEKLRISLDRAEWLRLNGRRK